MKSLLKFLGLDENATEEQAIAALRARDASFTEREQAVGYLEFISPLSDETIMNFGEHSRPNHDDNSAVNFATPPGYGVDPARLELHNKALAWQHTHPGTSYDAAIAAIAKLVL